MTTVQQASENPETSASAGPDLKLEVIVIPVSDPDRTKDFYTRLGWREDADLTTSEDFRVLQFTPPGSSCSVIFGKGVSSAPPGSAQGLHLIVSDVEAARAVLVGRGAEVSEVFHDIGGIFHHAGTEGRLSGPAASGGSYGSFASFVDPDGNGWVLQEVTTRLPGRITGDMTAFSSVNDLSAALARAAAAHGEHEARTGQEDPSWPDWYAAYIVRERSGDPLPS
ncbi:VOC family protein [Marmoricola sp. URHB0036]|uniref:VOC family protein n=1 Tax=Marmoricola sp. URHB0036 TaxID=1298863 RepID=UPI00041D5FC7|nr:VOC family protein [Marmoricola sp. URHB0036]